MDADGPTLEDGVLDNDGNELMEGEVVPVGCMLIEGIVDIDGTLDADGPILNDGILECDGSELTEGEAGPDGC